MATMKAIHRLSLGLAVLLLAGVTMMAHAQGPRVVLFEDPTLSAERLHYPLLISEGRGYRILCASQEDEEAVIRGLGFTTVPSQILTAVDEDITTANPTANPSLCPSAADFQIQVFASDGPGGLLHYLQFPSAMGSSSFTDRLYIPGCTGLVEALKIDLSQAHVADPTPFFQGKIHTISCLSGIPIDVAPGDFTAWCMKGDRTPSETATVMAMLDATPGGISALGNEAACAAADAFLRTVPTLNLNGKGVRSLAPLSVLSHLTRLSLADNEITDLSPLTNLGALTFLDLSNNQISNVVALAPLTALVRLNLADNRIEDVRFLSALTLLSSLSLDGNTVLDLTPLQFLQALTDLSLARNGLIGEMLEPLTALGVLTSLDLSQNNIESFTSLGEFPSTVEIDLSGNPIVSSGSSSFLDLCILHRDTPTPFGQTIRTIVAQQGGGTCGAVNDALLASSILDLSDQAISDVLPISALTHLIGLNLSGNAISDVTALSNLVNLVNLDLSGNNITDIRPVGPLTKLTSFDASGNPISLDDFLSACLMRNHEETLTQDQATEVDVLLDISGRSSCLDAHAALRQIQSANASGRGLSTLDYFKVMRKLTSLNLSDNNLTDLSALSPIQGLTALWARNNQITSMTAVTSLRRLERLAIDRNPLNSLNGITNLNKLKRVYFSGTNVRTVQPLASLPLLEDAGMRNLPLSYNSFSEYCLVQRFDSIALGAERAFMAAVETRLNAADVDTTNCNAVAQWAQSQEVLNLNKKNIISVKPIRFFTALKELLLYDNLIQDAQPIRMLRQLRKLNLSSNRIRVLPRFLSSQMQYLYLDRNDFSNISNLSNLTQLKTLNLKGNDITNPSAVGGISTLTWLDLRDNKIGSTARASTVLARKPYLKGNPVCARHLDDVGTGALIRQACMREPPPIWAGVIQPFVIQPRILVPVTP